jgi:epoxyqueuosine reductase
MANHTQNYRELFETELAKEGLSLLGIVSLIVDEDYQRYCHWVFESKHAEMRYLEKNLNLRKEPQSLLPGARNAIIFALPYFQGDVWPASETEAPRAAQYARFEDYHKSMRQRAQKVSARAGLSEEEFRVTVDSAPILERALAAKSQSGFIGKNTCFIHPEWGSFLLLGEILTTKDFVWDTPVKDAGCGTCTLCQVECPTGALNEDYQIDSRRCLSYWTIEHRGTIPEEFWPWLGKYYFGCDICQLVCPYNGEATKNKLPETIRPRNFPSLFEIATMDQADYERHFGGTPTTRAKRGGLIRNALIAMRVTGDPLLTKAMEITRQETDPVLKATLDQISKYQ